jgi:hypothetical protein
MGNLPLKTGRREAFSAAAFLALVIVLAFADVVFSGRTLLTSNIAPGTIPSGAYGYTGPRASSFPVLDPGASAWQYEPYVKILHDDLTKGWLPLWDPYVASGVPLLANMASAALSPVRLLVAAVERPALWDIFLLGRLFIAAFFTYLLARSIEIGPTGSLVAAIAFGLSGHFALYVNMFDLDVQIWVPALLLVAERLLIKPCNRTFAVTTSLIALVLLAGMPESALFMFLLAGLYFLVRAWQLCSTEERRWFRIGSHMLRFLGAGVAGLLISMPLLLPFFEYLRNGFTPRVPGMGSIHANLNTAVSLVMPRFFGHLHQTWTGVSSFDLLPYVGAACSLLALAALCRKRPLPRFSFFFAGFATFYLLKAFGIPPVYWIGQLPVFNISIFPKHAFPEFALSVALLAGMGTEGLLANKVSYLRFAVASLVLSAVVAGFAAHYWQAAISAGALRSVTRSCLIFAEGLILVWTLAWASRRFGPLRLLAAGFVLLPAAELIGFIPRQRTDRYDAFTTPPFVDFLRADREPFRTFSMDSFLYPNSNAGYGISDIRTLDAVQVERYMDFLRKEFSPQIYDRFDGTEPKRDILQSPLLDLMNVKYVLADSEIRGKNLTDELLHDSFVLPINRWGIGQSTFTIDGIQKGVLFQHPPSRIDYETVLQEPTRLQFALALDPKAWGPEKGDGVAFQVDAVNLSAAVKLFSEYLDPKNKISDRRWNVRSIDLGRYRGREICLIFQTLPGKNNAYDWAHWAQLPGGIQESLRAQLGTSQIIAPDPSYVAPRELTIGDQKLQTWGQHAPATVRFRVKVPENQAKLNFSIALDPLVWAPDKGDGVTFEILAAPVEMLFAHTIDPKNNPNDRKWHPESIDLSSFERQKILISFSTSPGANNAFDWAGWGDLRLEGEHARFDLVYDHEVKIYRNLHVLPRAYFVDEAQFVSNKAAILDRLIDPKFDPRKTVLLEGVADRSASQTSERTDRPSSVTFERYEANYIRLNTWTTEPGWLVLTDAYYPGWKVRVDGQSREILPADYAFRALPLEKGQHQVEFVYRPTSFLLGVAISVMTILILILFGLLSRPQLSRLSTRLGFGNSR